MKSLQPSINNNHYVLCIRCMTYNQEHYIEDALTGFSIQQTDFPFVAIIIDDASTDNNASVIKNFINTNFDINNNKAYIKHLDYGDEIFAQHKTNKNCHFLAIFLKENHYSIKKSKTPYIQKWLSTSKYHAFCEGDDYWIERHKLLHQVHYLEDHPECYLIFHNALLRFQDQNRKDGIMRNYETGNFTTAQIFEKWQLPLASVVCRKEIQFSNEIQQLRKISSGGFLYFIVASLLGKVYGISECWSVYRKNRGGVSNTFSISFIQKVELGLAYATNDDDTKVAMEEKAVQRLSKFIGKYYKKDKESIELVNVSDSFNKKIFHRALQIYISNIPINLWRKTTKLFRKIHK